MPSWYNVYDKALVELEWINCAKVKDTGVLVNSCVLKFCGYVWAICFGRCSCKTFLSLSYAVQVTILLEIHIVYPLCRHLADSIDAIESDSEFGYGSEFEPELELSKLSNSTLLALLWWHCNSVVWMAKVKSAYIILKEYLTRHMCCRTIPCKGS